VGQHEPLGAAPGALVGEQLNLLVGRHRDAVERRHHVAGVDVVAQLARILRRRHLFAKKAPPSKHEFSQSLVIDLLGRPEGVLEGTSLDALMPTVVPPRHLGEVAAGLCTHLHRDHADALAGALRPGAPVLHPVSFGGDDHENLWTRKADAELDRNRLLRNGISYWQTTAVGPFAIAAIPAVDALGDPQVSWAVPTSNCEVSIRALSVR
jgi:hypothetical protein